MNEYMDIFCPQYDADAKTTLKFIIYNVSKKSFETCVVSEGEIFTSITAIKAN